MRVVVCIKQVVDVTPHVALDISTNRLPSDLNYIVNPADLNATEEALRLKARHGGEVILISAGPCRVTAVLRASLSLGADQAIRAWHPALEEGDGYVTAQVLGWAMARLAPDLIVCGSRSVDEGTGQVPPALAEILSLPQVTGVTFMEALPEPGKLVAHRKLEKGHREVVECQLPAVVSVETSINNPRYPAFRLKRRAQKEPILELDAAALGMTEPVRATRLAKLSPPRPRSKKTSTVDISLSAEDRMKQIMSGGLEEKKGTLWEGAPEELAGRLARFLIEEGFLVRKTARNSKM